MSGPSAVPLPDEIDLAALSALGFLPNAVSLTVSGGVAFAYGELGYIHTDGTVRKAINTAEVTAYAEVMCVEPAGIANAAAGYFLAAPGMVTGLSGGTAGALAYVGAAAGAITTTPPATGWSKIVGKFFSATVLKFHADPSVAPFNMG